MHLRLYYRQYRNNMGFRNLFYGWADIGIDYENKGFWVEFLYQLNYREAAKVESFLKNFDMLIVGGNKEIYSR